MVFCALNCVAFLVLILGESVGLTHTETSVGVKSLPKTIIQLNSDLRSIYSDNLSQS